MPRQTPICQTCSKAGTALLKCATCKVVYYCSKECQQLHWSAHKRHCKEVKRSLALYKVEEEKLKHCDENNLFTSLNYFDDPRGKYNFWSLTETRDFCKSIGSRISVYEEIGAGLALQLCVELTMKFLFH